ncbi:hypothetical protein QJQ45_022952, partial [Haematococcus lacustris]
VARRLLSRLMIRPSIKFAALLDNETQPMNDLSLIGLKGPAWRVARKAFESAIMHKDALALHLEVMEQCVARLLARLARATAAGGGDGAIVNVAPLMGDLTLDVIGSCAFGVAFNTQEKELGKAALLGAGGQEVGSQQQCLPFSPEELVEACHNAFATLLTPWPSVTGWLSRWLACRFPDPPQRVSLHTRKVIVGTAKALIKAWEQDQAEAAVATAAAASHHASKGGVRAAEQSGVKAGGRVHEKSFLGLLLKGRDLTTGTSLDLQQVMAQIHVFLLAGYETTATALTFTLYCLAANPEAQRKLQVSCRFPAPLSPRCPSAQVEVDSQGELLALTLNTPASTAAKGVDCDPVAHQQAHARPAARPAAHPAARPELAPAGPALHYAALTHAERAPTCVPPAPLPSGVGLTAEEVAASFPYACAVLDEAMRLYPPAASALRSPPEDIEVAGHRCTCCHTSTHSWCRLQQHSCTKHGGWGGCNAFKSSALGWPGGLGIIVKCCRIPAHTFLYMPIYSYHHDADVWPDVAEFKPERHLAGHPDAMDAAAKASFMPFGHGARHRSVRPIAPRVASCGSQRDAAASLQIAPHNVDELPRSAVRDAGGASGAGPDGSPVQFRAGPDAGTPSAHMDRADDDPRGGHVAACSQPCLRMNLSLGSLGFLGSSGPAPATALGPAPATSVAITRVAYFVFYVDKRWRYRHVPGPVGQPLVGNLPSIAGHGKDITTFLLAAQQKYGPLFRKGSGTDRCHDERCVPSLSCCRGPAWRVARKAFESAIMHKDALALHLEVMEQCVARLLARLARITAAGGGDGAIVNVAPLMGDLTMDVVGSCVFGVAFNTQEKELGKAALLGAGGQDLGSKQQCLPYGPEELVDACHNVFATPDALHAYLSFPNAHPYHTTGCYRALIVTLTVFMLSRWLACRFPDHPQRVSLHARKVIVGTAKVLIKAWEQDQAAAAAAAASHHPSDGGVKADEQDAVKGGSRVQHLPGAQHTKEALGRACAAGQGHPPAPLLVSAHGSPLHRAGSCCHLAAVLSAHVTTAAAERNWSVFGQIFSKSCNRLALESAKKIAYIRGNSNAGLKGVDEEVVLSQACLEVEEKEVVIFELFISHTDYIQGQAAALAWDQCGASTPLGQRHMLIPAMWECERSLMHLISAPLSLLLVALLGCVCSEKSFLGLLLKGRDLTTGTTLDLQQVIAQIHVFLLAGYETTTTALTFTLYLLAANPEAQRKLQVRPGPGPVEVDSQGELLALPLNTPASTAAKGVDCDPVAHQQAHARPAARPELAPAGEGARGGSIGLGQPEGHKALHATITAQPGWGGAVGRGEAMVPYQGQLMGQQGEVAAHGGLGWQVELVCCVRLACLLPAPLPSGAGLTAEEVAASFPYACAVLDEAMRLYPPGATALRSPPEDIEVAGHRIPAHTFLYMPIYSYHHDADVWPDVAEFKPERHLAGHPDAMDAAAKASFMPFGHGARSCPGARFAMQEARVALVRMVRQFSFELAPMQEHPVRTWTGLTTTPVGGMWLRVHNRACA